MCQEVPHMDACHPLEARKESQGRCPLSLPGCTTPAKTRLTAAIARSAAVCPKISVCVSLTEFTDVHPEAEVST